MDAFSNMHPLTNFIWFAAVISLSFLLMHPASLAVSLVCAFAYAAVLGGRRLVLRNFALMLPIFVLTALINPLVNHNGATPLFMLGDAPVTLEALCYGLCAGAMFVCVLAWFSCLGRVITADKVTYLFGRAAPALSLILCMSLRFVPRYRRHINEIAAAQRGIGRDVTAGGRLLARARGGLAILSSMTTWALENAVETADSMRARGYGQRGRGRFVIFRPDRRDAAVLCVTLSLIAAVVAGLCAGGARVEFFMRFEAAGGPAVAATHTAYALLCLTPVLCELAARLSWARTHRAIG